MTYTETNEALYETVKQTLTCSYLVSAAWKPGRKNP